MSQAIFTVLSVTFAAFSVWLTVRIINRRERWAKWTAVLFLAFLAYPISLGPACWIGSRTRVSKFIRTAYRPLMLIVDLAGNQRLDRTITQYSKLGSSNGWMWVKFDFSLNPHKDNWQWVRVKGGRITLD